MKTTIIKIGNSKGVRLPKVLLEESMIKDKVELSVKKGAIIIKPIKETTTTKLNEEYAMSLDSLSDWDNEKEDAAWKDL